MTQPSISVIIPAYNHGRYFHETLTSVLSQTVAPREIIVIDDGSTDDTRAVAESFGKAISYHYQTNQGLGATRNAGIQKAQHDWLAFLDSDDLWALNKLEKQLLLLAKRPEAAMAFGMIELFHSPELSPARKARLVGHGDIMSGISGTTALVRADVFERIGLFPTGLDVGEFIDWFARAQETGFQHVTVPDVVAFRRLHGENISLKMKHRHGDYLSVVKAALDRRRKAAS